MKKLLLPALISTFLISAHAQASTVVEFTVGNPEITVFDEVVLKNTLDVAPFINDESRTMVPVRAISEAFKAEVSWNEDAKEVSILKDDKEIKLTIGSNVAYVGNEEKTLDCEAVIKDDRTFVPLRFIGEAFGYNVDFASTTSQIIIDDSEVVVSCGNEKLTMAQFEVLYDILYNSSKEYIDQAGMDEKTFKGYIVQAACEAAYSMVVLEDTFPGIYFSEEDRKIIAEAIKADSEISDIPLAALNTLIHEKYYFSTGNTIINSYLGDENIDTIYNNEYVRAKHILVEDKKTADSVYSLAKAGDDFDALVKEYGTDPGMEQSHDGYVFTYGSMVKEFETASFALSVGQISEPVESQFGYHIIKREELPKINDERRLEIAESLAIKKLEAAYAMPEFLIAPEDLINMI